MDIILYLFWLEEENYPMLLNTIIEYLKEALQENIKYSLVEEDIDDIYDCIVCKILRMHIRTEYTNNDEDFELTQEVYQIKTNIEFYINIASAFIIEGLDIIKSMVKKLEELYHLNMVLLDDSSDAVYIYSGNQKYVDKEFWGEKKTDC